MITIIKEGKLPVENEQHYELACHNCNTIYEFSKKDGVVFDYGRRLTCPFCGKYNYAHYEKPTEIK